MQCTRRAQTWIHWSYKSGLNHLDHIAQVRDVDLLMQQGEHGLNQKVLTNLGCKKISSVTIDAEPTRAVVYFCPRVDGVPSEEGEHDNNAELLHATVFSSQKNSYMYEFFCSGKELPRKK